MDDEPRYLKRKVIPGTIDVHPTESAIVVHYEIEATLLGDHGAPMLGEKKDMQKVIKVKGLGSSTNVNVLAQQIVSKCGNLVHPARIPEVEQLLYYLQNREETAPPPTRKRQQMKAKDPFDATQIKEKAFIDNIEDYKELLYEGTEDKLKGTALILQLTRNPDNLEELSQNETLIGALARVLREDWKQSIELATNIAYVFFCFSSFSDYHPLVLQHKVGATCMTIAETEIKKYDKWKADLLKKKKQVEEEKENGALKKDYEKSRKKMSALVKKQDQFFRVAFYLLLNISEDAKVELKMVNKQIVAMLVSLLDRDNIELLILVVSFLKKLSIFIENKNAMAALGVVDKMARLIPCDHEVLLHVSLRLLLNLSFDPLLRERMVRAALLSKLVELLDNEQVLVYVLCLLYHISIDDKCKSMFSYTDCVPKIVKLILECPEEKIDLEVIALGINLAANVRNAELMCEGGGHRHLMRRALKTRDSLLMKMMRVMSNHGGPVKKQFSGYVADLAAIIKSSADEEQVVECLGILANLNLPEIDFESLLTEFDLIPYMNSKLHPGMAEDDIVLEVVIFVGTVAQDEGCASLLSQSNTIQNLIALLNSKQEDDEVVLQIVYVFYQMAFHKDTRDVIVQQTQVPAYLIDLMHDKNVEIRKVCDSTLDIIAECDMEWALRIQAEKFRWHNSQWLETIAEQPFDDDDAEAGYDDIDDDLSSPLLRSPDDYLDYYNQEEAEGGDYYDQELYSPEMKMLMLMQQQQQLQQGSFAPAAMGEDDPEDIDEVERQFLEQQYGPMYSSHARAPYTSPYH
eukprot:m.33925 g.33925  ORF g.33925 m.33925 type:complete len:801 (+) comp31926_c0_seq8:57-2459(+)